MKKLRGLFVLGSEPYTVVYAPAAAAQIAQRVNLLGAPQTKASILSRPDLLREVDVLFSGWGCPRIDEAFLEMTPNLEAVFYAAGAINGWATQAVWDRNITVTTANSANAIPVAEYTVATILFSLKHGWRMAWDQNTVRGFALRPEIPGNYNSKIGLIGMGTIARTIVNMLRPFDMNIVTFDPFLDVEEATELGVRSVDLAELFETSDVVSLHAPSLPTTRGMVDGKLLRSMKSGATFINTSRGHVVREDELVDVLAERRDLQAVLDVTEIEPLPSHSPLNRLPNVVLTPHIAGSQGRECQRMGQYMVDELDRYLAGEPLRWKVRPSELVHSVHQSAM